MKRMLLEFIIMLALVILSGIVWANEIVKKSEKDISILKNQLQTINAEAISIYRIERQNRIRNRDEINIFYRVYNRNSLVNGYQYFYANGGNEQYKTVWL